MSQLFKHLLHICDAKVRSRNQDWTVCGSQPHTSNHYTTEQ